MYQSPASTSARKRVFVLLASALCIAAIAAHIHLRAFASSATGPLAILDHLFDLVVALLISFVILCFGHTLIKRFRLEFTNRAENLAFSFFLGTGVVALLVLFIGLLGLLRVW